MTDFKDLTLENVGNGAAMELFDRELEQVVENMLDPNTSADAKRAIMIKVTFMPHSDRGGAHIVVEADRKLAPMSPAAGSMFLGRPKEGGKVRAVTQNLNQEDMFPQEPNVRSLEPIRAQKDGTTGGTPK